MTRFSIARPALALLLWSAAMHPMPARAEYSVAPDVVVFCEPTLQRAVADIGEAWRRQTGVDVHIFASPTKLLLEQLARHPRNDLIIAAGDAAAEAAEQQALIKPETRVALWRNHLVIAGRRDTPPIELKAITPATPIALVDPWADPAGMATRKGLAALGFGDGLSIKGTVSTEDAAFLLAKGKANLAVLYATDVAAEPGFVAVGPVPDGDDGPVTYWAAESANARSPNAERFLSVLRQAGAQAKADGLEVVP